MYGHFLNVFKNFIIERQGGENTWNQITLQAKCNTTFDESNEYNEDLLESLISLAKSILGLPLEPLLEMFGEYYFHCMRKKGYNEMFRNLGSNILEFLQNLDSIHSFMRKEYPDMIPPSFRCDEESATDRMILHYYSARKGLHPVVVGVIKEAAKTYYKMQLNVTVISITEDTVAEEKGAREHVEFDIQAKKIQENVIEDTTPTFLAQTKKNSEKQILQQDVEAVKKKLAQIRSELGENALPLVKARGARGKWKAVAKISLLHKGFVPNYPDSLAINPRMFIEVFPFHIIFDSEMKVHQSGVRIQQMMPTIRNRSAFVSDFFTLRYPNFVDFTYGNIKKFVRTPFILEFNKYKLEKEWADKTYIQIKGQMFLLRDNGYFLYVASPIVQSWPDLEKRNIKLADIPMWDVTRDFIMSDLELRVRLEKNIRQSLKVSSSNAGGRDISSLVSIPERLQQTQRELDLEKERSFSLYKMFLPRQIVDSVRKGNTPSGELFQDVTVLFCDIVQFLPMVARCSPNAVIGMLNSVYASFDRVTRVHDTYRVESVGDAYMVVSGLPERNCSHTERVANTALGMRIVAQDVRSPLTGENIQIRIGMHTGTAVAGVVGSKLPRYLVLGETAVVASKLESSGVPGMIHVSPTTFGVLINKGFSFDERGEVELRGYGPLSTYFLIQNNSASDEDLIGRGKYGNTDISFINEGKQDPPFGRKNKVQPTNDSPSSGVGSRPATGESSHTASSYKQ